MENNFAEKAFPLAHKLAQVSIPPILREFFSFAYMKCENKTQIRFSDLLFYMTNYTPL